MSFALRNRPFQDLSVGSGDFNVVFAGLAVTGFFNGSVLRMKNALSNDPVGAVLGIRHQRHRMGGHRIRDRVFLGFHWPRILKV
jgi:hypothetical protein